MVRQGRYKPRLTYWVGGFPDGCIWDVKLEHKRDSHNVITSFTFTDGWEKFAHDVCLTVGDTIVFKLAEEDLMSVQVFNQHSLLKEAHLHAENISSGEEEEVSSDDSSRLGDVIGGHNRGRQCNITVTGIKSTCVSSICNLISHFIRRSGSVGLFSWFCISIDSFVRLCVHTIPKRFTVYNGLDCLSEVEIEDPIGMGQTVKVEITPPKHNHLPVRERPLRFRFNKGWRDFYLANKLGKNQYIHFDVSPESTLIATIY